jgi:hypothetical protein
MRLSQLEFLVLDDSNECLEHNMCADFLPGKHRTERLQEPCVSLSSREQKNANIFVSKVCCSGDYIRKKNVSILCGDSVIQNQGGI